MTKRSAGIVLFRWQEGQFQVFLVHPGGPFWAKKDDGAWSLPKGLFEDGEDPLEAAKREFREETGFDANGEFLELGVFKQPSGKTISAWAVAGDCDPSTLKSNTFFMEWPPRSGKSQEFPEVDRGGWFRPNEADLKITKGQVQILHALRSKLEIPGTASDTNDTPRFDEKGQSSLF